MATIRSLSNGKFRADIRKNYTFIQSKTFLTKKQAEKWASDIDSNIETILNMNSKKLRKLTPDKVNELGGMDLFIKLGVEIEFVTFKDLAHEYMMQWDKKDPNQIPRTIFWMDVFDKKPIKSIKTSDIRKALDHYAKGKCLKGHGNGKSKEINQSRSSNTVIRMKAVLSSIFKYAIRKGYLKENPVDGVIIDATSNKIERYLDDRERIALLNACQQSIWPKLYLLVLMAMTTGMRRSELLKLRWTDIDFEKGLAKLKDTKNAESRQNPIPSQVLTELKKFREVGHGLIFASPRNPEKPFSFRKQWTKALEEAAVENFRYHDLRHTCASYLISNDATLEQTGQILGHKSVQTTRRYAHLVTRKKSEIVENTMSKILNS